LIRADEVEKAGARSFTSSQSASKSDDDSYNPLDKVIVQ